MIKIDVKRYCQDCTYFEPLVVNRPADLYSGNEKVGTLGDTIIQCEHSEKCKHLAEHMQDCHFA